MTERDHDCRPDGLCGRDDCHQGGGCIIDLQDRDRRFVAPAPVELLGGRPVRQSMLYRRYFDWASDRGRFGAAALTSVFLAIALVSPAGAVDFSRKFTQMDGSPFADEAKNPEASTLRSFAVTALTAAFPDEPSLSVDDRLARFSFAKRIKDSKGDLPLTAEETALLKMVFGKALPSPLFLGQAFEMLDPASVRKAEGTPISAPKK